MRSASLVKVILTEQTAVKKDMFIAALKRLHNVSVVCEMLNIGRATVYEWKKDDKYFSDRWDEAIQFSKEALETATYLKAMRGNNHAAITASIFLLKGMYPEKYADRVDVTQRFTIDWSKVPDHILERFNNDELTLQDVYNYTLQQTNSTSSEVGRSERNGEAGTAEAPESED